MLGKPRVNKTPVPSQPEALQLVLAAKQLGLSTSLKETAVYQTLLLPSPPEAGEVIISVLQAAKSSVCFLFAGPKPYYSVLNGG